MEPSWDIDWSTIGLNWIDRNSQARVIYELYLEVRQPFIADLEQRLICARVPPAIRTFYSQLFTKSTTEILYCLLYKFDDRSNTPEARANYRRGQRLNFRFSSILSEVMVSLLTTCLTPGCVGELESIHVCAGDLFCPVCQTQYEVKSKRSLNPNEAASFITGAPRGIRDLILGCIDPANSAQRGNPGKLLVISVETSELFQVSPLSVESVRVTGDPIDDNHGPWNLDDFSAFLDQYPERSFREYVTSLRVQSAQFLPIPLTPTASARLTDLRNHLQFPLLGQMLLDFQTRFRQEVSARGLLQLQMQGELSEVRPVVVLINEFNLYDLPKMTRAMSELQATCLKVIDGKIGDLGDKGAQGDPGGLRAQGGPVGLRAQGGPGGPIAQGIIKFYNHEQNYGYVIVNGEEIKFTNKNFTGAAPHKKQSVSVRLIEGASKPKVVSISWGGSNNIYINDQNLTTNDDHEEIYKKKYLKYKNKYIQLKLNIK